jgi:hypothetical protein
MATQGAFALLVWAVAAAFGAGVAAQAPIATAAIPIINVRNMS